MSKPYPTVKKRRILGALFLIGFIITLYLSHLSIETNRVTFGTIVNAQDRNGSQLVNKGIEYYDKGKFREAVREWEIALEIYQ